MILALVAPISLVLTGILVLVLQVLTFLVIVPLAPGVEVNGFLTALVGSFIYAAVNTVADVDLRHRQRRLLLRPAGVQR